MVGAEGKGMPGGLKLTSESTHEATLNTIRVLRSGKGRPRKRFPRLIYDRTAVSLSLFVID